MVQKTQTLDTLFQKTEQVGECFIWTRCKDKDGYGVCGLNGRKTPAHRASYSLKNPTEDLTGQYVLHKSCCMSRACINPDHLYLGTQKQNVQDQIEAGTFVKGVLNGKALLTDSDVRIIRASTLTTKQLSVYFQVSYHTIWDIKRNRSWKHLL